MLASMLHALPVLAADKSKVPFFIAGGALAAWAVFISMAVGIRRADFPRSAGGQRAVIAISVLLVAGAMSTAVITAGVPGKSSSATAATPSTPPTSAKPVAGPPVALAANPSGALKFDKSVLTIPAGKVTIDFTNMSPLPHNLTIAKGSAVLGATPTFQGGVKALTVTLAPGTYVFYCSVPGHRAAGMQGTIKVT